MRRIHSTAALLDVLDTALKRVDTPSLVNQVLFGSSGFLGRAVGVGFGVGSGRAETPEVEVKLELQVSDALRVLVVIV